MWLFFLLGENEKGNSSFLLLMSFSVQLTSGNIVGKMSNFPLLFLLPLCKKENIKFSNKWKCWKNDAN